MYIFNIFQATLVFLTMTQMICYPFAVPDNGSETTATLNKLTHTKHEPKFSKSCIEWADNLDKKEIEKDLNQASFIFESYPMMNKLYSIYNLDADHSSTCICR